MGEQDDDCWRVIGKALRSKDFGKVRELFRTHPHLMRSEDGTDYWISSAIYRNDLDAVKFLLDAGLSANERADDFSPDGPIVSAARKGRLEIVEFLLDRGAVINHDYEWGMYCEALTSAARGGHLDVIKLLVERGAYLGGRSRSGLNSMMEARFYGHPEVAEYLKSIGVKDVREFHPADYESAHERYLEHLDREFGKRTSWKMELGGEPAITILHTAGEPSELPDPYDEDDDIELEGWDESVDGEDDEEEEKEEQIVRQSLYTIGLSDRFLPDKEDPFDCVELRMGLSSDWPLDEESLTDPRWNWPHKWLIRIAKQLRESESQKAYPPLFLNGDSLEPLADNTQLCGWVGLRSSSHYIQAPDFRWIGLLELYPIYPEEIELVKSDWEGFMRKLEQAKAPMVVTPDRINLGK